MENHAARVDAGIGPGAAMNPDLSMKDFLKRAFNGVLNGLPARLTLPALEAAAVVGADAFPA